MSTFIGEPIGAFAEFTRLDDEMVKLVAYTIVSLRRGHEHIMAGGKDQILVLEKLTEEQFVARLIAQYTSSSNFLDLPEAEREADQKYLRVYYVVSRRWPREPKKFEERQIKVLGEIKDRLRGAGLERK
jgi:hypothetical protein